MRDAYLENFPAWLWLIWNPLSLNFSILNSRYNELYTISLRIPLIKGLLYITNDENNSNILRIFSRIALSVYMYFFITFCSKWSSYLPLPKYVPFKCTIPIEDVTEITFNPFRTTRFVIVSFLWHFIFLDRCLGNE